jgi:general secretion pathway protein C
VTTIALVATAVLVSTFTYECIGLTAAIGRLTEATRQSNAVALHRPPRPPHQSAPAPLPPLVPSLPPVPMVPLRSAIIRLSDCEYLVDRRLVDVVLEEQASLMRSVRVVPASVQGRTYPRLYGVRQDSLLGLLGFRDGDCLESINGFDLSTPERALEAYARLRTAGFLEARIRRGTEAVTLLYRMW